MKTFKFEQLLLGDINNWMIFIADDMSGFYPVILAPEMETLLTDSQGPVHWSASIYGLYIDTISSLGASVTGITMSNSDNNIETFVKLTQANEIGTCHSEVSVLAQDAALLSAITNTPIFAKENCFEGNCCIIEDIPDDKRDDLNVKEYVLERMNKFDESYGKVYQ